MFEAAVITVSDSVSRGERVDASGPAVEPLLAPLGGVVVERRVVPDDAAAIRRAIEEICDGGAVRLLLTTGGTGLGPRDVTPEATAAALDRAAPGLTELMRSAGLRETPLAALSRATAGVRRRTLVVNLPGSPSCPTPCTSPRAAVTDPRLGS
jgi:molybdopterin adenylyltransferase